MPYFKDKNILFIHIPKNAGMYIEKQLGIPKQIVSYKKPTDAPSLYEFIKLKAKKIIKKNYIINLEKKYLYGQFGGAYIFQHASLSEILTYRMLDIEDIENAIILAVHRHPVDRIKSIYKYWGFYKKMSFDEFCENYVKSPKNIINNFGLLMHLKSQYSYVAYAGHFTDKVEWIKFENLYDDFQKIINKYNLDIKLEKSVVNNSNKCDIKVSKNSLKIIEKAYKDDFDYFGYSL